MKELIYQPKALKQLRKIPSKAHIIEKCEMLKNFPDCTNIKALTNHTYEYRYRVGDYRVGDYRVFFNIVGNTMNIVSIEEVKKRDERTY